MQQPELLSFFVDPLEKAGLSYRITGSVAAIFYGEPRLTHDIDIVIHLNENEIDRFCSLFPADRYYCPPPEIVHIEVRRSQNAHFNLVHHDTGLKADCYPATSDLLHVWALQHRRRIHLREDFAIWLAPPEYVIVRKLQHFRDGGSTKHLGDIRAMLRYSGEVLDKQVLQDLVQSRKLEEEWTKVVSEGF
jgi:hypothetical protein